MAIAISICPKSLLPSFGEIEKVKPHPDWLTYKEYAEGTRFVKAREFWWAEYSSPNEK